MVWQLESVTQKMCRNLHFHSLTPVRLLLLCLCTSLFHQIMHFNEKNIAVISLSRLRDRTWLEQSKSLEIFSSGKQLEQCTKVRCYWTLQKANRAVQPWKPSAGPFWRNAQNLGGIHRATKTAPPSFLCFLLASFSVLMRIIISDGWRGTVNQYASVDSGDRFLKHLSIKKICSFPHKICMIS